MADKPFAKLGAFGDSGFFDKAFKFTLDDIVKWLQDCVDGKAGGERTKDETVKALLKKIQEQITNLRQPSGKDFAKPAPKTHFLRKPNENWTTKNPPITTESRFKPAPVQLGDFLGNLEKALNAPWWNPYDLLGFFLSVLGPAPPGATKNNFFLPLCAVYARWCSCIAGRPQTGWKWTLPPGVKEWPGVGEWPTMYNIMWRPGKEPTPAAQFFLGSSIAGANWKDTKGLGLWKITVQRQRFDIFYQNLGPKPFPESIFNEKCPAELRGAAFKYGNCAETYPFLFNIRDGDNTELRGLALQKDFMISQTLTEYDPYKGGLIWSNLVAACENCSHVIGFVGAKTDNFLDTYEESDAPTKPTTSQTRATMDNATTTPNPAAAVTAPPGWSNKPEDLKTSYYWGPDGAGTAAAASVGLTNAQGLLIAARSNGGDRYIFQDGAGKIYMWGMVTDDVTLFTKPTALDEIVAQLKLPIGKLSIETKVLDYIPSDG